MWPRQTDTSTFRGHLCKTSWRCLEEVFPRRLEDVLKRSWRGLGKTSWKRLEDVLKTSDQDEYIRLDQDVVWRRRQKMSSRCLQGVFIKANVCWKARIFLVAWWREKNANWKQNQSMVYSDVSKYNKVVYGRPSTKWSSRKGKGSLVNVA